MKNKNWLWDWGLAVIQRALFSIQLDEMKGKATDEDLIYIDKIKCIKEYEKFKKVLLNEADRGLILIIAAYIDQILMESLENKLIGNKYHKKSLFEFNGTSRTFSSKFVLSYSIGIIR